MQKNSLNLHIYGIHLLNPYKTVVSHLKSSEPAVDQITVGYLLDLPLRARAGIAWKNNSNFFRHSNWTMKRLHNVVDYFSWRRCNIRKSKRVALLASADWGYGTIIVFGCVLWHFLVWQIFPPKFWSIKLIALLYISQSKPESEKFVTIWLGTNKVVVVVNNARSRLSN